MSLERVFIKLCLVFLNRHFPGNAFTALIKALHKFLKTYCFVKISIKPIQFVFSSSSLSLSSLISRFPSFNAIHENCTSYSLILVSHSNYIAFEHEIPLDSSGTMQEASVPKHQGAYLCPKAMAINSLRLKWGCFHFLLSPPSKFT